MYVCIYILELSTYGMAITAHESGLAKCGNKLDIHTNHTAHMAKRAYLLRIRPRKVNIRRPIELLNVAHLFQSRRPLFLTAQALTPGTSKMFWRLRFGSDIGYNKSAPATPAPACSASMGTNVYGKRKVSIGGTIGHIIFRYLFAFVYLCRW